jgi:hypothetical protein
MRWLPMSLLVLAACGSTEAPQPQTTPIVANTARPDAPKPHVLLATIERTACYGWCPIYKLLVYADGALEYDGEEFVKTKGHATGKLAADKVSELETLFEKAKYLELKDSYESYNVTDMPSVITSFHGQGQHKTVRHYLGDGSAPKGLGEVEEGIDRIADIDQFIGTEQEREKMGR